jgi:RNA polymerase sigma-70 factor (ECF subfamily)
MREERLVPLKKSAIHPGPLSIAEFAAVMATITFSSNQSAPAGTLARMDGSDDASATRVSVVEADADAGRVIVELLRRRDPRALDRLVAEHGPRLTRLAWLLLGDAASAEDAVQETLIAAWDAGRRGGVESPQNLPAWLTGVLVNRCRKHRRSAARRRRRETAAYQQRSSTTPAPSSLPDEDLAAMEQALSRLDAASREIIVLRYFQQFSVKQTADTLAIPEGTVKSRCHAAIEQMRRSMKAIP